MRSDESKGTANRAATRDEFTAKPRKRPPAPLFSPYFKTPSSTTGAEPEARKHTPFRIYGRNDF